MGCNKSEMIKWVVRFLKFRVHGEKLVATPWQLSYQISWNLSLDSRFQLREASNFSENQWEYYNLFAFGIGSLK